MRPPRPTPPLFPYTTLFRSELRLRHTGDRRGGEEHGGDQEHVAESHHTSDTAPVGRIVTSLIVGELRGRPVPDRKSTRLNSSHEWISYAVFCLKKKKN